MAVVVHASLRPPGQDETDRRRVLENKAASSSFVDAVEQWQQDGLSREEAVLRTVSEVLDSPDHFASDAEWERLRPARVSFSDLVHLVAARARPDHVMRRAEQAIAEVYGQPARLADWVASGGYAELTQKLWRSYFASNLCPSGRAAERDEMLDWIRALALLNALVSPDPALAPLELRRTLRLTTPSMRGEDVEEIQRLLIEDGFALLSLDGTYHQETAGAVRSFQSSRGLPVDGEVGPQTYGVLVGEPMTWLAKALLQARVNMPDQLVLSSVTPAGSNGNVREGTEGGRELAVTNEISLAKGDRRRDDPRPLNGGSRRRARAFVIDSTGAPVGGATVVAKGASDERVEVLGILSSDAAGYVSFDLSPSSAPESLWLEIAGGTSARAVLRDGDEPPDESPAVVLQVDDSTARPTVAAMRPAVQNPELADWEISPDSFVSPTDFSLGHEACRRPVPVVGPIQTVRFFQIVQGDPISLTEFPPAGPEVTEARPMSLALLSAPARSDGRVPLACEIHELDQLWFDLGHSIGSVVYSLPLAPCESVKLAMIDAARSDLATRVDDVRSTEELDHELNRDRRIQETVETALRESQGGWSVSGGLAAGIGAGASIGATLGFSTGRSWGKRDLSGDSVQSLHDATVQATDVVRSLNSTVVAQATQTEAHKLETRTVTNHNHCHALTIQYFEVLRRLKLTTRHRAVRPGVLIPYAPLQFGTAHANGSSRDPDAADLRLILRWRSLLVQVLREEHLQPNFEAVRRFVYFDTVQPPPPPPPPTDTDKSITEVTFRITRGRWGTHPGDVAIYGVRTLPAVSIKILLTNGGYAQFVAAAPHPVNQYYAMPGDELQIFDSGLEGDLPEDDSSQTLIDHKGTLSPPIKRSQIAEIQVHWDPARAFGDVTADWWLRHLMARADLPDGPDQLVDQEVDKVFNSKGFQPFAVAAPPVSTAPVPPPDPADEEAAKTRATDKALALELIDHLRDHREYYSERLAALQTPETFGELLDGALGAGTEARQLIDGVPVTVSGSYIVFGFSRETRRKREETQEAKSIVSLPTRGLLAEAQLGDCNACEKRDPTRFWKWQESPCEEAPEISGITPGFRGQAPSLQPSSLPAAVVQITQPPSAPDPAGLASAFALLGKPDIFRDMSGQEELGQLLGGLAAGTLDLEKARVLAKEAVKRGAGSSTDGSGAGRSTPQTAEESYDQLQVIDGARKDGLITDEDAREAARSTLTGGSGGLGVMGAAAKAIMDTVLGQAGPLAPLIPFDPGNPSAQATSAFARMSAPSVPARQATLRMEYMQDYGFTQIRGASVRDPWQGVTVADLEAVLRVADTLGVEPSHVLALWIEEGKAEWNPVLHTVSHLIRLISASDFAAGLPRVRSFMRSQLLFGAFGSDIYGAQVPRAAAGDNLPLGPTADHDGEFGRQVARVRAAGIPGLEGWTDERVRAYFTDPGGALTVTNAPSGGGRRIEAEVRADSLASWLYLQHALFKVFKRDMEAKFKAEYGGTDLEDQPWVTYVGWNGGLGQYARYFAGVAGGSAVAIQRRFGSTSAAPQLLSAAELALYNDPAGSRGPLANGVIFKYLVESVEPWFR